MLWIVDCVDDPQIWQATNYSWILCFDTWNFDLVKIIFISHNTDSLLIFKLIFLSSAFCSYRDWRRTALVDLSLITNSYFMCPNFPNQCEIGGFIRNLGGLLQSGDGQNRSGGQSVFLIHCFPGCSLPDTEAACSNLRDMFLMFHWSQTQHLPSSLFITHPHTSGITLPPVSQASASHYEIKALKEGCWYFLFP